MLVSGDFELTELAGFYYTGVTCSSKQRVASGRGGGGGGRDFPKLAVDVNSASLRDMSIKRRS